MPWYANCVPICTPARWVTSSLKKYYKESWGYQIADSSPIVDAAHVNIPTLAAQVRKDAFTYAEEDVQAVYDAIPHKEKQLYWIEGSTRRFRGYTYNSEHPEEIDDCLVRQIFHHQVENSP